MTDEIASEKHGALASPTPPPGAAADWTIPQHWDELTEEDHWVWDTLFARQQTLLHGRAVAAFEEGLDLLTMGRPGVPNLDEVNARLAARTGWTVVSVPGIVPDDVFFRHLSERRFPAGAFIRQADQLDYLEEPDAFHDLFGHVPMLAQPDIADFMQALGQLGLEAAALGATHRIARLYWYTVEFGLAREKGALKIYGAGILSSFGEAHYSLESAKPHRLTFDLKRVLRTDYKIDDFQPAYFVVDRFQDILETVRQHDLATLFAEIDALPDLSPHRIEPADRLAA